MAIDRDTLVVGAKFEDSVACGVNGAQGDNSMVNRGAAVSGDLVAVSAHGEDSRAPGQAPGVNGYQGNNSLLDAGAAYAFDLQAPDPAGTPTCCGDGTGLACPCNNGAPGAGCANSASSGAALVGNGLLCFGAQKRWSVQVADGSGATSHGPGVFGAHPAAVPGATLLYQWWYRDVADTCGGGFNFSNAWATTWQ